MVNDSKIDKEKLKHFFKIVYMVIAIITFELVIISFFLVPKTFFSYANIFLLIIGVAYLVALSVKLLKYIDKNQQ